MAEQLSSPSRHSSIPGGPNLDAQLVHLENAQLVRRMPEEDLQYLFKHALTQESTYESLLLKTRRELHLQVAAAFEKLYSNRLSEFASLLAHHFSQAGNDTRVVEYAIRAGDYAVRLSAHPEAAAHYGQALDALSRLPDDDENRRARIDTLIKRTSLSFVSVSPEQNLADLRVAESLVENLLRAREPSPIDQLRRARVGMWSGRMFFYSMHRRQALDKVREVLPAAQTLGDQELAALALTLMARILLWEGHFNQATPLLQQTLAPLEQRSNWTEWILTASLLGVALAARGEYQNGIAQVQRAIARAEELHHQSGISLAYPLLAIVHLMGGELQQMLVASRTAVQVGSASGNMLPIYSALVTQAWAESRLGQHAAAQASMAQGEKISRAFGGRYLLDDWREAVKSEMALNAGDVTGALTQAQAAVDFARSVDGNVAEALARRVWAEALVRLNPSQIQDAETHLAASAELFELGEARLEAARTHLTWGKILAQNKNARAAREHLQIAAKQFQESGLERELSETRALLDAL